MDNQILFLSLLPIALVGVLLALIGQIWIVVMAFRDSFGWGVGTLIVPFVSLFYAAKNFQKVKQPFRLLVTGIVLVVAMNLIYRTDFGGHESPELPQLGLPMKSSTGLQQYSVD